MKKLILSILSLLTLSLASCGRASIGKYDNADKYLVGSQEYSGEIKDIYINWLGGTINLIEDEYINGVKVEETNDLTDDEKVHSYYRDSKLDIQFFASGHSTNSYFDYNKKKLTVTYKPGLTSLYVDLTSGTFNASKLTPQALTLDVTSGSVNVSEINSPKIKVDLTSGKCELNKIVGNEFEAYLTTGTFIANFEEISTAKIDMTTGSINVGLPSEGGILNINKSLGGIDINREYTRDGDNYIVGKGQAKFYIDITTGSVNIH